MENESGSNDITESERLQIQHIRELEMEELEVEEVDHDSSTHDSSEHEDSGGFTFNAYLASLHSDIGEVEGSSDRIPSSKGGGAILNLPMFYLEGIVLFPEATIPLIVIQPRYKAAVEKAMNQHDLVNLIGVVRVHRSLTDASLHFAIMGTTAEIQQHRQLEDGSLSVVTNGQQRFYLRRRYVDMEGVPWAEVQIVEEDIPLRTPKDAFGQLASVGNFQRCHSFHAVLPVSPSAKTGEDRGDNWDSLSNESTDHSMTDIQVDGFSNDSSDGCVRIDDLMSSDDDLTCGSEHMLIKSDHHHSGSSPQPCINDKLSKIDHGSAPNADKESVRGIEIVVGWKKKSMSELKWLHRAPRSFWPHWVYQMYDSYYLARRAAGLWRKIIRAADMDDLINKPGSLSFHIASRIPVSETTRQELLEINGISYRLRREIELLENFDLIRCKTCLSAVARRSDNLAKFNNDGPLSAYANMHGYVHEVLLLYDANGLVLIGSPVEKHKWFPGYAWTIANCMTCESNMGWLFTATNNKLRLKSFWGIRISQVADCLL